MQYVLYRTRIIELNAFKLPNVYMAAIFKGRPIMKYLSWIQLSECDFSYQLFSRGVVTNIRSHDLWFHPFLRDVAVSVTNQLFGSRHCFLLFLLPPCLSALPIFRWSSVRTQLTTTPSFEVYLDCVLLIVFHIVPPQSMQFPRCAMLYPPSLVLQTLYQLGSLFDPLN